MVCDGSHSDVSLLLAARLKYQHISDYLLRWNTSFDLLCVCQPNTALIPSAMNVCNRIPLSRVECGEQSGVPLAFVTFCNDEKNKTNKYLKFLNIYRVNLKTTLRLY